VPLEVESVGGELLGSDVDQANQLIDMAGRYQRTGRYSMPGQDLRGWGPLRPAIAVPMVTDARHDGNVLSSAVKDFLTAI
jgi:hypothetical protein